MQGAKKKNTKQNKKPGVAICSSLFITNTKTFHNDFVNLKSKLKSRIMYRSSSAKSVHL